MDLRTQRREETLEKIKLLLEADDSDALLLEAAMMLTQISDRFVARICYGLKESEITVDLLLRCVTQKAHESLSAIIELVKANKSYSAMALLRPMTEELIFITFLLDRPVEEAQKYIRDKASLEILQGVKAQERFFPEYAVHSGMADVNVDLPDPRAMEALELEIDELRKRLKALGSVLGWGATPAPTVKHMAEATELSAIYDFFYHASSSAVHASLHHLLRMVWSSKGTGLYSITNQNFDPYYKRFSLVYGSWLATRTMWLAIGQFNDQWPEEEEDSLSILSALFIKPVLVHRGPKIVTAEELRQASRPETPNPSAAPDAKRAARARRR